MARTITENQYMELIRYADGHNRWVNGGPVRSLLDHGYLAPAAHDRSMHHITPLGEVALNAFRDRYGLA